MTLDSFLKECSRKGMTPVSYKESSWGLNGSRTVEYVNPKYAKARDAIARVLNRGRGNSNDGNSGIDDLVSNLYGEDIVIRTRDGYHHGKFYGYGFDGKSLVLTNYRFSNRPMDIFDYSSEFFIGSEETIIPSAGIISISKIPIMTEEFA